MRILQVLRATALSALAAAALPLTQLRRQQQSKYCRDENGFIFSRFDHPHSLILLGQSYYKAGGRESASRAAVRQFQLWVRRALDTERERPRPH